MRPHRILAVALVLLASGCGAGSPESARQAGSEAELESERRAPLPAPPRTEVVAARFFHGLAVIGGLTADGTPSAQVDRYFFPTDQWNSLPALPIPIHHAGAGELDDRLYVVGGYTTGALGAWTPTDQVWSLGNEETTWRKEPPLSAPRGALAVASLPGALVAVGGVAGPDMVRT